MDMVKPYCSIDHTGDIGVEVEGKDPADLLCRASWALSDTLVEIERVQTWETTRWALQAESLEALLVAQLQEILFRMDAEGRVFGDYKIEWIAPFGLTCEARGQALDRRAHGFKTEIKAVTYHGLKVEKSEGRFRARIIFDV